MRKLTVGLTLLLAALVAFTAGHVVQAAEDPQDVVEKIALAHADPNDLLRLLSSDTVETRIPGRKIDFASESLIPEGIGGLLAYPLDRSLLVRGSSAAIATLKKGLIVSDVPHQKLADGISKVTFEPVHTKLGALLDAVQELPDAGKVTVDGKRFVLEGKPEWIHRALRIAIRLEMSASKPQPKQAK